MAHNDGKIAFLAEKIERGMRASYTLVKGCTAEYEGTVKRGGSVRIAVFERPTIFDYNGGEIPSPENVVKNSVELAINQGKGFNYNIGSIDAALGDGEDADLLLSEIKGALTEAHDAYVGSLAVGAKYKSASLTISTPDDAIKALLDAKLRLRKNNVPTSTQLYADIPWEMYELLVDKAIDLDTNNTEVLTSGALKRIRDINLRPSNNLFVDKDGDTLMMVRTKRAIAFADAVETVEHYKHSSLIGDSLRGCSAFGGKITRPDQLYVIKAKVA